MNEGLKKIKLMCSSVFITSYTFIAHLYLFILTIGVCISLCVCVHVCTHAFRGLWRPEYMVRTPQAGVTHGCELPSRGAVTE